MFEALSLLTHVINLLAIAGGGGSSSGGGGGGGGGSSGGSSSGGGSGGDDNPWVFVFFVIIFVVVWYITYKGTREATKRLKIRRERMKAALEIAAAADIIWEPGSLEAQAKDTFLQYQKDWSAFDLDSMKQYMTPRYHKHNQLMMGALRLHARQNDVQNPAVLSAEVFKFRDSPDDTVDAHTIQLSYRVHDVLNDTAESKQLFAQDLSGTEFYKFIRSKDTWKFDGIDQATANPAKRNIPLEEFAANNKFFYSLDWGHLLLPSRGQLFSKGSFGVSDINNHVIGLYKEIIIQLYTYQVIPGSFPEYLIAQTSVPKKYGNIVVRRAAKGLFPPGVKGLRKVKMEWQDFNSMYEVFASDAELATSFELLNPKFMEQLQALPFEVNIEVVDNIVYLYTSGISLANSDNYATMLTILKAAFKEMRM
jgi:hypothetical protein